MIAPVAFSQIFDWDKLLLLAMLGVAGVCVVCRRLLPRALGQAGFVLSSSTALAVAVFHSWPTNAGPMQDVARVCSALALAWSLCAAAVQWSRGRSSRLRSARRMGGANGEARGGGLAGVARDVGLLFGAVAASIQSVVLAMRAVYVGVDLINGYPQGGAIGYGFGTEGVWSLAFLFGACTASAVSTGDRRLGTCQLWSAILASSWVCMLAPAFRTTASGGFERTGSTLLLAATLSTVLGLAALFSMWFEMRRSPATPGCPDGGPTVPRAWPGLSSSATVIAVAVILLVCYHLAVPIPVGTGGFRGTALLATASAAMAAFACFLLVARAWNAPLGDTAVGLTSLAFCGLATAVVPSEPVTLAERYPMTFNAMMVGLTVAAGLWTHLTSVWQKRLRAGQAGTTTSRLIPHAKRFVFLNASLALVLGAVMAVWPRWRTIATMDDSFGRVAAGFSANLFLLLTLLWCSRRLHRLAFQVLTVLSLASTAAFLTIRMLPFTSKFG